MNPLLSREEDHGEGRLEVGRIECQGVVNRMVPIDVRVRVVGLWAVKGRLPSRPKESDSKNARRCPRNDNIGKKLKQSLKEDCKLTRASCRGRTGWRLGGAGRRRAADPEMVIETACSLPISLRLYSHFLVFRLHTLDAFLLLLGQMLV